MTARTQAILRLLVISSLFCSHVMDKSLVFERLEGANIQMLSIRLL